MYERTTISKFDVLRRCLHLEKMNKEESLIYDGQCNQIYKDVIRTDRFNTYYKGEDNKHLDVLL